MNGLRIAFNIENLQAFVYAYAGLKWLLKTEKTNTPLKKSIIILLRLALTIPITLTAYLIILIFAIYYEITNLILKLKHGEDYVGILQGTDVIWTVEDKNRSLINSLFLLEVNNESHHEVHKFFSEAYQKLCHTHPKLGCVRRRYMGYQYFLKTKIDITKFVRFMDDYDDEREFQSVLDSYSNSSLPLNDTALWEIYVGKTALKWKRGDKPLYPVLVKYHHSVGDGITIVAMCTTNMLRDGVDIMQRKCETYREVLNKNKGKRVKSVVQKMIDVCSKDFYIKYCGLLIDKQYNLLHGKELSGEKHLCWALEDAKGTYVDKVKDIKNRFIGISFSDVLLAAISASFAEYYTKHDRYPPKTIRAAMTYFFSSPEFKKIVTYKNGHPVAKLNNKFSIGIVDIPIKDSNLDNNMINRLFDVHKDANLLKNALDFPFIYWQLKVVSTVVPMPLLLLSVKTNDNTLVVTNVPGNNTATLLNGHVIRDTIIWAPNYLTTGLTISIFTYDNLFRFGLMVDKALMADRKDVQSILDNVFKYIDYLDAATKTL